MGYGNPCCNTCVHKNDRCYCGKNSACSEYEELKMVNEKAWNEFKDSGLLWWINMILHTFGWAIVIEIKEDGTIPYAYPARVKFRGFDEKNNSAGYIKVSQYIKDHANELFDESSE